MNKSKKIWIIVAVSLIVVGVIFCAVSCGQWGAAGIKGLSNAIHDNIDTVKDKLDEIKDIELTVKEVAFEGDKIKELEISAVSDEIILGVNLGSDQIIVKYPDGQQYGYLVYAEKDTLKISWREETWLNTFFNHPEDACLEIWLPASFMTAYDTEIEIDTVSGNVSGENICCSSFSFDAVSSDLTLSGEIDQLECGSVSGNISFSGKLQEADINSASGDATLNIIGEPQDYQVIFDTVSGSINGTVGSSGSKIIEIRTTSGDLYLNFSQENESKSIF